jgi:hypothetical protein
MKKLFYDIYLYWFFGDLKSGERKEARKRDRVNYMMGAVNWADWYAFWLEHLNNESA